MCVWGLQVEKDAGPLTREEEVGTWFSNPAADTARPAPQTGGVGKYLSAQQLTNLGGVIGQPDAAPAAPPSKKAKQAAYGNFDAW